jgi:Holliday junction resolvase RusA-like endonuclease
MIKEFYIDLKVTGKLGFNSIYSGQHWAKRQKQAEEIHGLVVKSLIANKIKRQIFDKPVIIEIYYNSRLDIDNHGYLSKLIIDGLKGYLIEDDNKNYVVGLCQFFHEDKRIKVVIRSVDI